MIGLNPSAPREAGELKRLGNRVTLIGNAKTSDRVELGGRFYDLGEEGGIGSFLGALKLSPAKASDATTALRGISRGLRDEFGKLVAFWALREASGQLPGRLLLSGEHAGSVFWGKHNEGFVTLADIRALAKAFPKASAAVEDLHVSACNSANEIKDWPSVFPNLQTIWAYRNSCPSPYTGALYHLRMWDKATRGGATDIKRDIVGTSNKGDHVVIWSLRSGYQSGTVEAVDVLRARVTTGFRTFDAFFRGDEIVANPSQGPLRTFYDDIQDLLRHVDLAPAERTALEAKRDATVRLLYYEQGIKSNFARQYRGEITAGFEATGLAVPDFNQLNRKDALATIAQFQARADAGTGIDAGRARDSVAKLRSLLIDGLRDLKVPPLQPNWVE